VTEHGLLLGGRQGAVRFGTVSFGHDYPSRVELLLREGRIKAAKWIEALSAKLTKKFWYMDGNRLLTKPIFIASAVDIALLILLIRLCY
jgi:hypothetical protein